MADNGKWAEEQTAALIEAGLNPLDAQQAVQWVLDNAPGAIAPGEWIPTGGDLYEAPDSAEAVHDSRSAWYAADAVPGKFKRLLDAREDAADA